MRWLPDIFDYLQDKAHFRPVSVRSVDPILSELASDLGLPRSLVAKVAQCGMEEVRSALLRGKPVHVHGLGRFSIASPRTTGTVRRIQVRFRPSGALKESVRDRFDTFRSL